MVTSPSTCSTPGYAADRVGSSVVLVRDGDALIVVDPGMVARRSLILDPLAALGVAPEAVTHVFLSHHHPTTRSTSRCSRTPRSSTSGRATATTCGSTTTATATTSRPNSELWLTPGHTEEDASLIVRADDGVYAMTHLWWRADRTPEIDPLAADQAAIERGRARVLAAADIVIPGHGAAFRVRG